MSRSKRTGHYSNQWTSGGSSWGGGYSGGGYSGGSSYSGGGSYSGSYGSSFDGIEWLLTGESAPDFFDNFDPYDTNGPGGTNSTIYQPIDFPATITITPFPTALPNFTLDIPNPLEVLNDIAVTFDVSKKEFKVAAGYSFDSSSADDYADTIAGLLDGTEFELPTGLLADFKAANDDYDIFASLEVDGYGKAGSDPKYAKNFIVDDEFEIYLGLVDQGADPLSHADDVTVAELNIEVELTKKGRRQFDILFDGGREFGAFFTALESLSVADLNKYIDEIEITYEINVANDPLVALFQTGVGSQLAALAGLSNLPELKFDIEIEAGRVAPSKWAHEAFHAFIPVINADDGGTGAP